MVGGKGVIIMKVISKRLQSKLHSDEIFQRHFYQNNMYRCIIMRPGTCIKEVNFDFIHFKPHEYDALVKGCT